MDVEIHGKLAWHVDDAAKAFAGGVSDIAGFEAPVFESDIQNLFSALIG